MTLEERIRDDMKSAMRARDRDRLKVLRLILAAIKQVQVDTRAETDDAAVLRVLEKMLKQRRDSVEQFTGGGRKDLADIELAEISVLESYLPEPLPDDALDVLIEQAIAESGATGMRDMGKVMSRLREATRGRADMAALGGRVRQRLSG